MTRLLALALTLAVAPAFAQVTPAPALPPPPATMTKIVQRFVLEGAEADSFRAQPKTIYIGGKTFSRIEESANLKLGTRNMVVVNEPDIWVVDLAAKTGQHMMDSGPVFEVHHELMPPDAPKELKGLEFGREREFFDEMGAKDAEPAIVEEQSCQVKLLETLGYRMLLYTRTDTKVPFKLDVTKEGKKEFVVRYLSYETGLPFEPKFFKPPLEVTLTESRLGTQ